jgi:glycosyltransferase involved in cell wall biosynthesis
MAPLPIAVVMTSFEPGGTERQMIELIRRLDPSRWTVHLACFEASGTWFPRAAELASSVAEFPVRSFKHASTVRHLYAFAQWCRARRIAVVHATEFYSNIFALPGASLARVPARIGSRRGLNPDKSRAQLVVQRAAYSCADTIVANSRAAADRLIAERVPGDRVAIVPNGVDFDRVVTRPPRPTLRKVVVVANLRPEKGHDLLIDASVDILRAVPDATFDIVGSGSELEPLLARAHARGVAAAFRFLGHQDDVPEQLADADIFVLPSRSEALPNAVLEAMATGLPIVTTAVGGMLELIEHGRTGLLADAGDAGSLAEQISRVMTDPALAGRLGRAARDDVRSRFSFERMIAGFEQVYLDALARRGVVPPAGQRGLAA